MLIEWAIRLGDGERWFYGLIVTAIVAMTGVLLAQRVNHSLACRRDRHSRLIAASAEFRSAFADIYAATSVTSTADNRAIYSLLLASRSNHDRAAEAFASHLGFWRRRSFAKAWKHYEKTRHSNPYSHGKIQSALQDILRFCE